MVAQVVALLGGNPAKVDQRLVDNLLATRTEAGRIHLLRAAGVPHLEPSGQRLMSMPNVQFVQDGVVRVNGRLQFVPPGN